MFGSIGGPEIILIFIVALIVFGPKRLPEIGRKVGRVVGEIRRAGSDLRSNIEREIGLDPIDGLKRADKARRELISSLSEPIRDVTEGTLSAVRETTDLEGPTQDRGIPAPRVPPSQPPPGRTGDSGE